MKIPKIGVFAAHRQRLDFLRFLKFGHAAIAFVWFFSGCGGPPQSQHQFDVPKDTEKKAEEQKDDPKIETKGDLGQGRPKPEIDPSKTVVIKSEDGDLHGREKSLGKPSKDTEKPKEKASQTKVGNERIRANDEVLRSLESANIAFNAPDSLNIEDTARIQLLLSLQKSAAELKSQIEGTGKVESAAIRVSDRMEAELSGSSFEITAITPKEQAVATEGEVEWNWEVKPKAAGRHQLHLTLTAILSIQGKDTRRTIRTFDKIIEIEVTSTQKIVGFFEKAWQWLWAAILVPIVGWLWRKRNSKQATPDTKPAG